MKFLLIGVPLIGVAALCYLLSYDRKGDEQLLKPLVVEPSMLTTGDHGDKGVMLPAKKSPRDVREQVASRRDSPISLYLKEFAAARSHFEGRQRYEKTLDSFKRAREALAGVELLQFVHAVDGECPAELKGWLYNSATGKILATPEDRDGVKIFLKENEISSGLASAIGNEAGASKYDVLDGYLDSLTKPDLRRDFIVAYERRMYLFGSDRSIQRIVDYAESSGDASVLERFVKVEPPAFDWGKFVAAISSSTVGSEDVLRGIEELRKIKTSPVEK